MTNSVAKNTAYMTAASIGQKIIAFVYFTLLARQLGPTQTGIYVFTLSFTTIFVVFVDIGLTNVFIREAAKDRTTIEQYLATTLFAKLFTGGLAYIAMFLAIRLLGYDASIRALILLSGITMLSDSLHLTLYGTLRALGSLRYEAASIMVSQFATLVLGGFFLSWQVPLIFLILAFTIPSLLNVGFVITILRRRYGIRIRPRYDPVFMRRFLALAAPFALAAIFARVYGYIDVVILSKLANHAAVGIYSIAAKITFAFQFIPLALMAALYPRLSEYYAYDRAKLVTVFRQGMKYLLLIVCPIITGILLLAGPIVRTLYTAAYQGSILPLQILISSLLFSFLSFPVGGLLNATNRQTIQTAIVGSVMVLNILLNFLLIPYYGPVGAAIAAWVGNFLLTAIGYCIIPRIVHFSPWGFIRDMAPIFCSALFMGMGIWLTQNHVHFVLALGLGFVIYAFMLLATRAVTRQELQDALLVVRR